MPLGWPLIGASNPAAPLPTETVKGWFHNQAAAKLEEVCAFKTGLKTIARKLTPATIDSQHHLFSEDANHVIGSWIGFTPATAAQVERAKQQVTQGSQLYRINYNNISECLDPICWAGYVSTQEDWQVPKKKIDDSLKATPGSKIKTAFNRISTSTSEHLKDRPAGTPWLEEWAWL